MKTDRGLSIVSMFIFAIMLGCHREMSTPHIDGDAASSRADATEAIHGIGAPASQVTWELESAPSNATVVDLTSKQSLGQTPWRLQQPASQQTKRVRIEKSGYEPLDLELSLDRSEKRMLVLRLHIL